MRSAPGSPSSAATIASTACSLFRQQLGRLGGGGEAGGAGGAAQARAAGRDQAALLSRRRVWRSEPTAAASSAADISPARSASSTARCLAPSRPPPLSASSPAGRISARSSTLERTCGRRVPVPGGSTSCRPREGVEQYSRATQRPSRTSSGRGAGLQRLDRLGQPLRRQLRGLGQLDHDPEQPPRAEGDADDAADLQVLHRRRPAVVERAPQSAGGGQRLDPEDGHPARVWPAGDGAASSPGGRRAEDICWRAVSLNLSSGEQVIFEGHPSWRAILGFYLKGIVVASSSG